jgi:hypothetical protein
MLQGALMPIAVPSRLAKPLALALLITCALLGAGGRASAELLYSDTGFFVDPPEGFSLANGDGKTRFAFLSPDEGMEFDILTYEPSRYPDAQALAKDALAKIGSAGQTEAFSYQGRTSVFAELVFTLGGTPMKGYAIFIGPRAKPAVPAAPSAPAAPGAGGGAGAAAGPAPERSFAVLAYTQAGALGDYADFILSCLDCFSIDRAALRAPGPVSQYLLPWPAPHDSSKTVSFGESRLDLPWSAEEAAQEEDTAGREFRVLEAYGQSADLWRDAWVRAYRMIYRESAARLDRLAIELDRLLPDDPTDAARKVLAWTQGFVYERNTEGIDFVDPLTSAYEARGDCDSRAMVAAIILERRGIDSILMVSDVYSHALLGVDVPGGGQRFPFGGKQYLVGETTAKVGLGMVAADQADWTKWIGIQLGGQ